MAGWHTQRAFRYVGKFESRHYHISVIPTEADHREAIICGVEGPVKLAPYGLPITCRCAYGEPAHMM
jgi:hypothetical protein